MVAAKKRTPTATIPELARLKRGLSTLSGEIAKVQKPVDRTYVAVHGAKAVLKLPRIGSSSGHSSRARACDVSRF